MADIWRQSIVVSCFESEPGFNLHCEPEGAVQELLPGDVLTVTFTAKIPHLFEISRVAGGIVLARSGDSEVSIDDRRGRSLTR